MDWRVFHSTCFFCGLLRNYESQLGNLIRNELTIGGIMMNVVSERLLEFFVADDDEDTYYRAVVLGLLVAVAEFIGGAFMRSLALISDGVYAFIVATSIIVGMQTLRLAKKWPAHGDAVKKCCAAFGSVFMLLGAIWISMQAWDRVLASHSLHINGWSVAALGLFGWVITHIQHRLIEQVELFGSAGIVARHVSKMYILSDEKWQSPAIVAIGMIAGVANMFGLSPVFPVALDVIMSTLIALFMAWGAVAIARAGKLF